MLKKLEQEPEVGVMLESTAFDLLDEIADQFRDLVDEVAEEHARQRQLDSEEGLIVSSEDVLHATREIRQALLTGAASNSFLKETADKFLPERK